MRPVVRVGSSLPWVLVVASLLLRPDVALAQPGETLTHTCAPAPAPKLRATLDNFADKTLGNTLIVSGTCDTSENPQGSNGVHQPFVVAGFTNLTIKAGSGGVTFQGPNETCTPGTQAPPNGGLVLWILDSSRVALENLTITGGRGMGVENSRVLTNTPNNSGNTFSGSRITGISVSNGGSLTLKSTDVVENSCQFGISVSGSSSLSSGATIRNSGDTGVFGQSPAAVLLQSGSKIHGNGTTGVLYSGPGPATLNQAEVYNNGLAPVGFNAATPSGVMGTAGAAITLSRSDVHDNSGVGVLLRLNATGVLRETIVNFNPGGGLNLNQGSTAELQAARATFPSFGPNLLQGNGGGNIGDVNCDAYSQAFGDLSVVSSNKCALQGGSGK